jgi:hypothetical protein
METFSQDMRYAHRTLWKTPGLSMIAILALALGSGANTVMFSIVYGVLIRSLQFPDAGRISSILVRDPNDGKLYTSHSYPNFEDIRDQNLDFERGAGSERGRGL